jgi:hypothetical protein
VFFPVMIMSLLLRNKSEQLNFFLEVKTVWCIRQWLFCLLWNWKSLCFLVQETLHSLLSTGLFKNKFKSVSIVNANLNKFSINHTGSYKFQVHLN